MLCSVLQVNNCLIILNCCVLSFNAYFASFLEVSAGGGVSASATVEESGDVTPREGRVVRQSHTACMSRKVPSAVHNVFGDGWCDSEFII